MSFTEKLRAKSASLKNILKGGNQNEAYMPESDVDDDTLLGNSDNFLTLWGGVLATLSFMIGGGICSISYSMN